MMNNERRKIVRNAIQTPDGTVLESRHRHDFQSHIDTATKERYYVDGGLDYVRIGGSYAGPLSAPNVFILYEDDDFEVIRRYVTWGTRGKNGDEPLTYVPICEMTTEHLRACLETQDRMYPQIRRLMEREIQYREFPQDFIQETDNRG